jgi:hypothetical protein
MSTLEDKIGEKAGKLRSLMDKKEELKESLKSVEADIKKIAEQELPKLMEDAELEKASFQGIGTLYLETKTRVSVLAADKPDFIKWLKANGHGAIVKEDVNPKTLESWGKEVLDQNISLPEVCKVFHQSIARIRRK